MYRPRDAGRVVLYLKDINLPKPDKYATAELVAFLQQLVTYNGFYDKNLDFVGLQVCNLQLATCNLQLATCNLLLVAHDSLVRV